DESWAPQLNRAADALIAERERRKRRAADEIATLLTTVLTATVTVPLRDATKDKEAEERGRAKLREIVRRAEAAERRAVLDIYHHEGRMSRESSESYLSEDVFSARSFSAFGLSTTQLAFTGAASGAGAGGIVDVAL